MLNQVLFSLRGLGWIEEDMGWFCCGNRKRLDPFENHGGFLPFERARKVVDVELSYSSLSYLRAHIEASVAEWNENQKDSNRVEESGFTNFETPGCDSYSTFRDLYFDLEETEDGIVRVRDLYTPFGRIRNFGGESLGLRAWVTKNLFSTDSFEFIDVSHQAFIADGQHIGSRLLFRPFKLGSSRKLHSPVKLFWIKCLGAIQFQRDEKNLFVIFKNMDHQIDRYDLLSKVSKGRLLF